MKSTFSLSTILAFVILVSTAFVLPADKIKLRLNLKKGEVYKVRSTIKQDILQTIMGQEQRMEQNQINEYTQTVIDKDNQGNMWVEIEYTRIKIKTVQNGVTTEFDSDQAKPIEEIDKNFKSYAALKGQKFQVKYSPLGEVLEMRGVDKMWDDMLEKMDIEGEAQKEEVRKILKTNFGEKALTANLQKSSRIYPEQKVDVGDTWSNNMEMQVMMKMKLKNDYTLRERKNGFAFVDVVTDISTNPDSAVEMSGMKMTFDLSGEQEGYMKVDEKTGLVVYSIVNQDLSGDVSMSMSGQDMSWPMDIKSDIIIEEIE